MTIPCLSGFVTIISKSPSESISDSEAALGKPPKLYVLVTRSITAELPSTNAVQSPYQHRVININNTILNLMPYLGKNNGEYFSSPYSFHIPPSPRCGGYLYY